MIYISIILGLLGAIAWFFHDYRSEVKEEVAIELTEEYNKAQEKDALERKNFAEAHKSKKKKQLKKATDNPTKENFRNLFHWRKDIND